MARSNGVLAKSSGCSRGSLRAENCGLPVEANDAVDADGALLNSSSAARLGLGRLGSAFSVRSVLALSPASRRYLALAGSDASLSTGSFMGSMAQILPVLATMSTVTENTAPIITSPTSEPMTPVHFLVPGNNERPQSQACKGKCVARKVMTMA